MVLEIKPPLYGSCFTPSFVTLPAIRLLKTEVSRPFGMQISCASLNFVAKTGAFARDSGILARLTS